MAELPTHPSTDDDRGTRPDHEPTTGTPRWVFWIGAGVVILAFLIMHLTGSTPSH